MCHFRAQNGPFVMNTFFLVQTNIITFIYLLALSLVLNLKKSYSGSRVMRMNNFWVQNGPFPQMRIFFRKPVSKPCFFHSCLSTCQKSKSDINLLVKYWQLNNTKISLAESDFWLYLENQIFPKHAVFAECQWTIRTFILHKFQTKPVTWDFLKSPKTMFLGHFWPFLVIFAQWGFFPKKIRLTHNYIRAPNSMLSFRKN